MTEADLRLLHEQAAWVGPVIDASRALLEAMEPLPLCAVCPSAQWYRTADDKKVEQLEAFCTQFRGVMYDRRKPAVVACDARIDAIAGEGAAPAAQR